MTRKIRNTAGFVVAAAFVVACVWYNRGSRARLAQEPKPATITCVKNLRGIGLAFRVYAGAHGDQFPFNISTNAGGTLELCAVGTDGFDRSAALHLGVMTNEDELSTPRLLVCPDDKVRSPAASFSELRPEHISYSLRTGTNISPAHPEAVLIVCPIDGNTLRCDGVVLDAHGNEVPLWNTRK